MANLGNGIERIRTLLDAFRNTCVIAQRCCWAGGVCVCETGDIHCYLDAIDILQNGMGHGAQA